MKTADQNKIFASVLMIILIAVLVYAVAPFFKALFGAVILYVLFRSLFVWLNKKFGNRKGLAAMIVIIVSLIIIVTPLFVVGTLLVSEIPTFVDNVKGLQGTIDRVNVLFPQLDLRGTMQEIVTKAAQFLQQLIVAAIGEITNVILSVVIMYVVLFYLLVKTGTHKKMVTDLIPFNAKNSRILIQEFENITNSVVISTGLIALLQGFLLGIGFWFFNIPSPVFWGVIGAVLSFLPVVGTLLIWIPAGGIALIKGNYFVGVGMLVWGTFLSNIDNILRPLIQRRVGKMHPLVSFIGVFIGIPLFGLLGLIIGPLLLSYFFLTIRMYKEEYL